MKVDVLVIGGGSIGASCAYYLAEAGKEVLLIEREDTVSPITGCSYANAGLISPGEIYPLPKPGVLGDGLKWLFDSSSPLYIKPRLSLSQVLWLLRFTAASRQGPMRRAMPVLRDLGAAGIKAWDELGSRETLDAGYEHKGLLTLYSTSASFESAIAGIEALKAYNVEPDEVLDAAQVRQRVPAVQSTVVGGTLAPGDAKVDPMAFTREMARLAAEKGATIMSGTEALGFTLAGRRVASVRTTRGTFEPGTVVLAAGIWSSLLAKGLHVKLPIQAAKGYSVTVARPEGIPEDLPLFLTEGHVCVTPYGGDLRLAGTLEISGINTKILQNRVAGIRQGANEFLTGVATEPLLTWRGLRSLTPDGMPIISRSSAHDNLVVATGHNMNGIKFGPVTGKLVAEIVTGQKLTIDVRPLRLERFH